MRMTVNSIVLGLIFMGVTAFTHTAFAQARAPLFQEAVTVKDYQKAGCAGADAPVGSLPLYKVCKSPAKLLKSALKTAKAADLPLLVVWGFDQCAVCRKLERKISGGGGEAPFSANLFSYALSDAQQNSVPDKGVAQRVMILRMHVNSEAAGKLARAEGLYDHAAKMGRTKLWSPLMTFYNSKTRKWVSYSAYSGFEKPCRLGDEIALALADLGYIPNDPDKTVRMCKSA